SQETLLQIEKKNPLLMVYYLFMCPSFTSRRRYRGKLVEPFSIKDQIATIECRGFPDNLACNLQKIKRFQRKLIRVGATVSFGVRLSDNPSFYFQAEYPFIIDHNEQDEHQRFRSRGMGQYDGEGESDDFEEDTLWNNQNVEKQRNGQMLQRLDNQNIGMNTQDRRIERGDDWNRQGIRIEQKSPSQTWQRDNTGYQQQWNQQQIHSQQQMQIQSPQS
ncbi:MAG: hypothetical protein EZS28_053448, partial [Streblomastix strix]